MFKKITSIALVLLFTLSSPASAMDDGHQEPTYNSVISIISSLWEKENQLRQTWSYTGLTALEMVAPVLEYSALGICGVLGRIGASVAQYNASPLLKKLSYFLPSHHRSAYENAVDELIRTFHISAVAQNPLRHGSGYLFGSVGVYIVSHIFNKCPTEIKDEVEGFAYFCFKKAGFHFHDHWEQEIHVFLEAIPQTLLHYILPTSSSPLLDDQQCQPFVNPLRIPPLDQEALKKLEEIRQLKINVHPDLAFETACRHLSEMEQQLLLADFYNRTAPLVMSFIQQARKDGKEFGILMGERHETCSCLLLQIELYKLIRNQSKGYHTHFCERDPESLSYIRNYIEEMQNHYNKSFIKTRHIYNTYYKIAYATQAGFHLKAAEPKDLGEPAGQFVSDVENFWATTIRATIIENELRAPDQKQDLMTQDSELRDYIIHRAEDPQDVQKDLQRLINIIYIKDLDTDERSQWLANDKSSARKLYSKIKDCALRERDKGMDQTLEDHEGDFSYDVGACHLGTLQKLLNIKKNRVYLALTCDTGNPYHDFGRLVPEFFDNSSWLHHQIKRAVSQECVDEYIALTHEMDTFRKRPNPCLTFAIDDEELASK